MIRSYSLFETLSSLLIGCPCCLVFKDHGWSGCHRSPKTLSSHVLTILQDGGRRPKTIHFLRPLEPDLHHSIFNSRCQQLICFILDWQVRSFNPLLVQSLASLWRSVIIPFSTCAVNYYFLPSFLQVSSGEATSAIVSQTHRNRQ